MRLAIVIPAYNAAPYLREAIESALRQTVAAAAVIVMDDGSTDETPDILRDFAGRITAVRQENAGMAESRNRGAAHAESDWLLFLDADDRLLPDALAQFEAAHEAREDAGVIYGQSILFGEGASASPLHGDGRAQGPAPAAARANFWKSALSTPGVAAVRRDLFQRVGGFVEEYNITADRDFWIKTGTLAEFAYTGRPVLEKRLHGTNASRAAGRLRIQGARVQLDYPAWCERLGVTPAVRAEPAEIIDRNLRRALESRQFDAVAWLLAEAGRRSLRGPLLQLARRLLAGPGWWREVELAFRQRLRLFP